MCVETEGERGKRERERERGGGWESRRGEELVDTLAGDKEMETWRERN